MNDTLSRSGHQIGGCIFSEPAHARLDLRHHVVAPALLLALIQNELNGSDAGVFDCWPQESIKKGLRSEHEQADVKIEHFSEGTTRELRAHRALLRRPNEYGVRRLQSRLHLHHRRLCPLDVLRQTPLLVFAAQIAKEKER